ncbi:hypothetical protein [Chiayiivirga flava]|uniref:Putative outer membrane repeat protein n=1 Tax=Chiayiivirga flava TaxID=659595 RepID=A0A7W8G228_9GAMM|nr:hypothetical protein [Chiayiivirga flava]MBB5209513.1 putative outer membrane repeat protein [Chiayiivirga flava]
MTRLVFVRLLLPLAALCLPFPLHAGIALPPVVLTVGNTGNCDHNTIQDAIDAAPASGSAVIRISNNVAHSNQALTIVDRNIELRGGYPGCDLAPADPDARTTLRGSGGSSVVLIDASGDPRTVILRNLVIRDGGSSDPLTEYGGGVRVNGLAQVEIRNSHIADNESHEGGGIAISGIEAQLLLDDGAIVGAVDGLAGNRAVPNGIASVLGGGIACRNATVELRDARVRNNTSAGDGGGLYASACTLLIEPRPDYVEGSNGANGFATFFQNHADINGGAIRAHNGLVFWRSSEPGGHFGGRASGNTADNSGGALHLTGPAMQFVADWVRLEANDAPNAGGAVYLDDDARFSLRGTAGMRCDYATCPGIVESNFDPPSSSAGGGAIYAVGGSDVSLSRALLANNIGLSGSAVLASGEGTRLTLRHVLVHRNFLAQDDSLDSPIDLLGGADGTLIHVTMSTNVRVDSDTLYAPVASSVLVSGAGSSALLFNSIFTDDGVQTVRTLNGGAATGSCLLSHESASVSGVTIGDPQYVDPLGSAPDFTPGPTSPALDRCETAETFPMAPLPDFTGRTRPIDLPPSFDGDASFDMGAIERQREVLFADGFELPMF